MAVRCGKKYYVCSHSLYAHAHNYIVVIYLCDTILLSSIPFVQALESYVMFYLYMVCLFSPNMAGSITKPICQANNISSSQLKDGCSVRSLRKSKAKITPDQQHLIFTGK